MSVSDRIIITDDVGVRHIRLNRPDKMNALDDAMFEAVIAAGEAVKSDASVRCVVISGEGRAFCAGMDVSTFSEMAAAPAEDHQSLTERTHGIANRSQYIGWVWRECPVPVIFALHGTVFGAGLQMALGGDIRIAHPDTRMGFLEIKWGFMPDMGGPTLTRGLVRPDVMKTLAFTGKVFSGSEGEGYCLLTQLSESPLETALDMAKEIASKNPDAIRAGKTMFNEVSVLSEAQALLREAETFESLVNKPNQLEAVKAAFEKRAPVFK